MYSLQKKSLGKLRKTFSLNDILMEVKVNQYYFVTDFFSWLISSLLSRWALLPVRDLHCSASILMQTLKRQVSCWLGTMKSLIKITFHLQWWWKKKICLLSQYKTKLESQGYVFRKGGNIEQVLGKMIGKEAHLWTSGSWGGPLASWQFKVALRLLSHIVNIKSHRRPSDSGQYSGHSNLW